MRENDGVVRALGRKLDWIEEAPRGRRNRYKTNYFYAEADGTQIHEFNDTKKAVVEAEEKHGTDSPQHTAAKKQLADLKNRIKDRSGPGVSVPAAASVAGNRDIGEPLPPPPAYPVYLAHPPNGEAQPIVDVRMAADSVLRTEQSKDYYCNADFTMVYWFGTKHHFTLGLNQA